MKIQNIRIKQELQKIRDQIDYIYDEADDVREVEKISTAISEKLEMLLNIIDWEEK